MIRARAALFGNIRTFFETELPGFFRWDQIKFQPAELADPIPGKHRAVEGKYKAKAVMMFGDYHLEVYSSQEHPPLGLVILRGVGSEPIKGTIDETTWRRVGSAIRSRETRQVAA